MFNFFFSDTVLSNKIAFSTLAIGLTMISGVSAVPVRAATLSGFEGPYAPNNWTLTNNNADGFVDLASAPNAITLTGGDNGSNSRGNTNFTITAPGSGNVSFNYDYSTVDVIPLFDPFGIILNGNFTQITDDFGPNNQVGIVSFDVDLGDTFGFSVQTLDNILGSASVTISEFEAPAPIPEPGIIISLLTFSGLGIIMKREKQYG